MTAQSELLDHFGQRATTVCRLWAVTRKDRVFYGFTDHDCGLSFQGMQFKASSGMTARALLQTSGLSVDNSETEGALSDAAIDEADLIAGRFDGAEVQSWLVNWTNTQQFIEVFRGNFGEISRSGGAFKAELRGLSDRLNQPQGRIFQRSCSAVLGDARCGVNLSTPGHLAQTSLVGFDAVGRMVFGGLSSFANRWFERGRLQVLTGPAAGLTGMIKLDRQSGGDRLVDLWHGLGAQLMVGDTVRLEVGCDRSAGTCRTKFANFQNYRGFPHSPGEDWLSSYPASARLNDGGSLGR